MKHENIHLLCYLARDAIRLLFRKSQVILKLFDARPHWCSGQEGNDAIRELLLSGRPFFVGRIGYVESVIAGLALTISRLKLGTMLFNRIKFKAYVNDEFWPRDDRLLLEQGRLFLAALPHMDVYVCWDTFLEHFFSRFLVRPATIRADFLSLESFCYAVPWSSALKGKKVLVICPYPKTVARQYAKHELLWEDKTVLPDFELYSLPSVYGRGSAPQCKTWFEALDYMYAQAMGTNFDVAILACGPFAVPLGHRFKLAGRSAITMCGVTQILFGIKGRRWDNRNYVSKFYNMHWVRADIQELPEFSKQVENGCYL